MAQAGQFRLVGHVAVADELLEADRQRHQSGDPWHPAGGCGQPDFAGIELREAQEAEIKRLREHREAGRISEADFLLLVRTRVYGQSVADYARDAGLGYQAAKKRRQRAEAAIRRFEEKSA